MVSGTAVEYLGRQMGREIIVAGADEAELKKVSSMAANGRHQVLDVRNDTALLTQLISEADLVLSLLPASFHVVVAEVCIEKQKNLVTASYESDEMRKLGARAKMAGITILNEVGLDPGLDHCSAMQIIEGIQLRGGTVTQFESYCGGLPAPNAADNPLKYKFSWSPRGVLSACLNNARYSRDGSIIEVKGPELLRSAGSFDSPWNDLELETLPNRDSLVYMEKYGIESAETVFRGTLRYSGFSALMQVFLTLGFFNNTPCGAASWHELFHRLSNERAGGDINELFLQASAGNPETARTAIECSNFLGLFEDQPLAQPGSLVDSFCHALETSMKYKPHEADMILMHHKIVGLFNDGSTEYCSTTLQAFGNHQKSAMALTVGYTAGIAADMILNKEIASGMGLLLPTSKNIYRPILSRMAAENIIFVENTVRCVNSVQG
jgi:alpha-aminoadipic semialdehyde synthase